MKTIRRLALIGLTAYVVVCAVFYMFQRDLMYFPDREVSTMKGAEKYTLVARDGTHVEGWFRAAKEGHPLFLYFHGNGGNVPDHASYLRALAADGSGYFALDYRGYGGSEGHPSESGILQDAQAAYDKVRSLGYDEKRIVVIGESLGSGPAVAIAATNPLKALVLDSAFDSTLAVAKGRFPFLPVFPLMKDTYRSDQRIGKVHAPILFFHGTQDEVIPLRNGSALYALAPDPKKFIKISGANHVVLRDPRNQERMRAWLATL